MLFLYAAMIDDKADQIRFEEIYYGYHKQMFIVAERILHNQEDAEDAVQNALIGIAKNIKVLSFRNEKVLRAYVLTAAKNAALNMLPQKLQRDKLMDINEIPATSDDNLFQQVMVCQDYRLLLRAIRQLDQPYREVLMLAYVHGHGPKATAQILSRKEETVRKQLYRGRKLLIELCRKEGMNFVQDRIEAI